MSEAKNLTPRIITRRNFDTGAVDVLSAHFAFGVRTLVAIADEFGVEKSNEKATTIMRGFNRNANVEVAHKIKGHRFILDRSGRSLPMFLGHFTPQTRDIVSNITVCGGNEGFYKDEEMLNVDLQEAVKYKVLLKQILMLSRLLYINKTDQNILTFEVTGDSHGEGLIQAVFQGGAEDRDLYFSLTETTNFKLSEIV